MLQLALTDNLSFLMRRAKRWKEDGWMDGQKAGRGMKEPKLTTLMDDRRA